MILLVFLLLLSTHLLSAEEPLPLLLALSHTHGGATANASFLRAASLRSAARYRHRHRHRVEVPLPLSPGGDYTLSLSLGHGPSLRLYLDTGSDLVWAPCAPFSCMLCEGKPGFSSLPSPPLLLSSSPVSCHSSFCSAAHSSLPSADLCAIAGCPLDAIETSSCSPFPCPPFYYAYGDGSLLARLRLSRLSLSRLSLPRFAFGCAAAALAEPVGVAGFGPGSLSFPAQLSRLSPHLGHRFSYCLAAQSTLVLGRRIHPQERPRFSYTPFLADPRYYAVGLEAVSVGSTRIPSPAELRTAGLVVDSGTTFTMLPPLLHARISSEFSHRMARAGHPTAENAARAAGLGPCFFTSRGPVPTVALHFAGNATLSLPRRNYYAGFVHEGKKVGCLAFLSVLGEDEEDEGAPAGTLGNFQQRGFEVVYDIKRKRVGFARRSCSGLWETLSRG
ncbi:eukaryotic aspartyl protease family protein [Wolffia australiana]